MGLDGPDSSGEAELTPEKPNAEVRIVLPPKAGFLDIRLTDRTTGAAIRKVSVKVTLADDPDKSFEMTLNRPVCTLVPHNSCAILIPPDKPVLVHVWSEGFREWNESAGTGKPLRIATGDQVIWDVQLEPLTHPMREDVKKKNISPPLGKMRVW